LLKHSKRSLLVHGLQLVDLLLNQAKKQLRIEMQISLVMEQLLFQILIYDKKSRIKLQLTIQIILKTHKKSHFTILEMESQDSQRDIQI
jgi:hypothetical protein